MTTQNNCTRLFFDNFADTDVISNYFVTSQQSAFPIENAFNRQRRSKVYRSGGFFRVESGSNSIIFRETSGGPDLEAVISATDFTSLTAMCAGIKTALEAVGGSVYTVTNSITTNWKFKIESDGAGGTGVFHLMLTDVGFTAASLLGFATDSDFTDSSLIRYSDFLKINTSERITFDFGLSTNPQGFGLVGPLNKPLKLSPGGTYRLQANHTNSWDTPPFSLTLTYNDLCFFVSNATGGLFDTYYRYASLEFLDQSPLGYIEVGAILIGNYFDPSRGGMVYPVGINPLDRTQTVYSEGGSGFSDIRDPTTAYAVKLNALKKADCEALENYFRRYGTGLPFFAALDTGMHFSTSVNRRFILCKFAGEPKFDLTSHDYFSATMILREEI